ncbi:MAG: peptidoglycan editing factor PgeF [Clostridiales bacterium]|nr:peptidoglycan editing factor PgeF [Clostridiales bacterium]
MIVKQMSITEYRYGSLVLLKSDLLQKAGKTTHAFTTRYGGVSKGIFKSMNLALNRGDSSLNVEENYQILCENLGFKLSDLVFSSQVHEDGVRSVTGGDRKENLFDSPPYSADALITSEKELPLVVFTADCIPILLYGEDGDGNGTVGAVHAGWRGTALNIAGKVVRKMREEFHCLFESMIAAIGPGIGSCCFETGSEVAEKILKLPIQSASDYIGEKNGKTHIDLKGINRALLIASGLKRECIEVSEECTKCYGHKYWSHRGTKGNRGAQIAVISLTAGV